MILHVIDNLEPGGAQTLLFELASRIEGSAVLCLRGLPRHPSNAWERIYYAGARQRRTRGPLAGLLELVGVCIREHRGALFVAHLDASTAALCVLKPLLRLRLCVMVHASPKQWPRWYRWVFRVTIRFADLVIAGGERHKASLLEEGVSQSRIVLAGIGSSLLEKPPPDPDKDIREELGIQPGTKILLNVARMVPGKGQSEIIRALSKLRSWDVVAVIVGDGPEEARLKDLARKAGVADRAFFPGKRTDLHNFYGAAAALLMPCLDESMGVVVLEALAYRVPVIAYNSGNISEYIEHGRTGFLISADVDALVRTVDQILRQPPALDLSEIKRRYSMSAMVERFRAILEEQGATSGR